MSLSKLSLRAIPLLACAVFFAAASHAQFRAGIQGTVTDSTGAVVKGANITVTNQETGASQDAMVDDAGFYSVSHLGPGLYTVSASLAGFKAKVIKDVRINAEETTGVNVVLEPGAVTEQITVNGDTLPTLQTEDASIGGTVTKEEVQELPQFRGDPFELLRLTPGVFGLGARTSNGNAANFPNYAGTGGSIFGIFQTENSVQVSAGGQRVDANGYTLDGISTNSQRHGGATVLTPNEESVKEVKVEVSPYSAENGHNAGAIIETITQNGTNNFHGSAVFRLHSPGLNATQRWCGPGCTPTTDNARDNILSREYLGSLGGPIWRNKVFAFFSFEHMRTSGANRSRDWVETPQFISSLQSGTIAAQLFAIKGSGFLNTKALPSTCAILGITDTNFCRDVPGGVDVGSPTGSKGTAVPNPTTCPANEPGCLSIGGGFDGVPDLMRIEYSGKPDSINATQFNGRLDYNISSKDTVAFSIFRSPFLKTFLPGGWVDGRQYNTFNTDAQHDVATLLWTRTINATTINEARVNVLHWYFDEQKGNPQAPWGLPTDNIPIPMNSDNNSLSAGFFNPPGIFHEATYTVRDTLSKVHNSHVLKFGGEFTKEQNNDKNAGGAHPFYNFTNLWSFINDAPNDQNSANFDPKTGQLTAFAKYVRVNGYAVFGQDNWKARPNLTLSFGLRYDYWTPLHDKFGQLSHVVLGQGADTLLNAKIVQGGNLSQPDRNNFGPQFGFAWSPRSTFSHEWHDRMVWRGGFGVAYTKIGEDKLVNADANPPSFVATALTSSQLVYAVSSGGPYSFFGYPANPLTKLTFDPNTGFPNGGQFLNQATPNLAGPVQDLRTPYTYHYSLETQYDLSHNWTVALGYQGSQSRKLPRTVNYQLFFPHNPLIGSIRLTQSDVNSGFNALIARISRRLSNGLDFNVNYRYSKSIDFCSYDENCGDQQTFPFNQNTERGPSDYDVKHSLTGFVLYELPFARNRHDWLHTAAGGWKLSTIVTLNSGFPWTPVYSGPGCISVTNLGGVCPVRPAAYLGGAGTDYSTSKFQQLGGNFPGGGLKYFTAPPTPPTGGFTVPPPPGVGRNSFRGPRYTGIDMSFGKRFGLPRMPLLGENAGFEIKANAFNIFNKLNLSPFAFNSSSTNITNPQFGQATSALSGRVFELMARFNF
jgi:hypothetical protein